jgi:CheY-like chemotaxis protein
MGRGFDRREDEEMCLGSARMPRMNGIDAASAIKGMMPQVPIVLFTLYGAAVGDNAPISAAGIDAVLSKPDGGWKLLECVRDLLQAA